MSQAQEKEKRAFSKILSKAATETVNLVVGGAGILAAAATQWWSFLALGGVAYASLVAWDMVSPEYQKKALAPSKRPLPEPSALSEAAAREIVKGLITARAQLSVVLQETPDTVKRHLGSILAAISELEERAAGLLYRAEVLNRYLKTTDPRAITAEIERLEQRTRGSRDEHARAEYQRAMAAKQEQRKAIEDIENAKDRVMAQLSRIQATAEGLPPKIVRMRALDAQAMDTLTGEVSSQLDQMNDEVQSFEETLASLAGVS